MIYTDLADVPKGHYACLYADPPWAHETWSEKGQGRSPSQHYKTMTLPEIRALPIREIAARDAFLFMWCRGPNIVRGDHAGVIRAWGFEPSAMGFVWIKTKRRVDQEGVLTAFLDESLLSNGTTKTTLHNAEIVFIGRRGSPKRLARDVHEVIFERRRAHSQKPVEAYRRIERFCAGPRIELFGRNTRPEWDAFGNEVGKYGEAA